MAETQSYQEAGQLLVAALERHGVKSLFSVSGGPINSVYQATTETEMRIVHTRHEAAAGFMADSIYRATRQPGVVVTTLGPAVMNTVNPAATALAAGVPFLIIGGQASTKQLHKGAGMELDTMSVMRQVTKWSAQVLDPDRIPEFVDEAWRRMCSSASPGPVYLEIPSDVLSATPGHSLFSRPVETVPTRPDDNAVATARALITSATRPLVIAGDGVYHDNASQILRDFVSTNDLPVTTLRLGRGSVDEETDPHWAGPAYTPANSIFRDALGSADLILLLGHHWEFDLEFGKHVGPDTRVIQTHRDQALLGRNGPVDLGLCTETAGFLTALGTLDQTNRDGAWTTHLTQGWRSDQSKLTETANTADIHDERPHPISIIDSISAARTPRTRMITSHGNIDFWADARLTVTHPGTYLRAGQSGTLGAELPFGIGSAIDDPDEPSIVIVGDGGVGYHISEFETAVRFNAPVVIVVLDDNSWGAIAMPQHNRYGVEVAMALPPRDWAAVGQSLGGNGVRAHNPAETQIAIEQAIHSGTPTIIQIPVRPALSPYMGYGS